jgi:hypothetical protein
MHTDFFAMRVSEYSKGVIHADDWNDI